MSLLLVIGVADALAQCGMGPRKHLFFEHRSRGDWLLEQQGIEDEHLQCGLGLQQWRKTERHRKPGICRQPLQAGRAKSYLHNIGLAGGLGYTFLKQKKFQLQVVGKAGSTIGNADWKNNYYDASLRVSPVRKDGGLRPVLGVGYRYANSHNADFCDHGFVYGTIAFMF